MRFSTIASCILLLNAPVVHAQVLDGEVNKSQKANAQSNHDASDGSIEHERINRADLKPESGSAPLQPILPGGAAGIVPQQPVQQSGAGASPQQHFVLQGGAEGGQEERWIDWAPWKNRIGDVVYQQLAGMLVYGQTIVTYDVSRDRQIRIVSVNTPDPTGRSGQLLVQAILRLTGSPVLDFPPGTMQPVHRNFNGFSGPPMPVQLAFKYVRPSDKEQEVRQW